MKKIILFDWDWCGHVPLYAESLCRLFHEGGWNVHHVCPSPRDAEQRLCVRGEMPVTCHAMAQSPLPAKSKLRLLRRGGRSKDAAAGRWEWVRRTLRQAGLGSGVDFVFFPWLDPQLDARVTPRELPAELDCGWGGLILNAQTFSSDVALTPRKKKRQIANHRLLNDPRLRLLATLDELAVSPLQWNYPHAVVRWMPDLIEASPCVDGSSTAMGIARASGLRVLLSVGVMHRRKGFLNLLRIALRGNVPDWFFLIAGPVVGHDLKQAEQRLLEDAISGRVPNVAVANEQLSESQVNAHVASSDAVFLGYESWFQSSNILTRACHFRVPVLSCPQGLLAHRTRSDRLGWVLEDLTVEAIEGKLLEIDARELTEAVSRAGFDRYARRHRREALAWTFATILDNDLGLPKSAA